MRRAFYDSGFIEDDIFYGVSLGYDFTAEHEWGIEDMKFYLDVPKLTRWNKGVKSRMINVKNPKDVIHYLEDGDYTYLYMYKLFLSRETPESKVPTYCLVKSELDFIEKNNSKLNNNVDLIITAWDSKEFGMLTKGNENREKFKELYNAILNHNVILTYINLTANNPFANASLSLIIADRLPKKSLDDMVSSDEHTLDLEAITNKLDLKNKLKKCEKFSDEFLSPSVNIKFIDYKGKELKKKKKELNTKYDVEVWLSFNNFYAWCTVEEILQLINDKNLTVDKFKEMINAKKTNS